MKTLLEIYQESEAGDGDKYFNDDAWWRAKQDAAGKSRATIIHMSPDDFLKMAAPLEQGPDPNKEKKISDLIKSNTKFEDIPYLSFDHDGEGTAIVTGHEGRHRMLGLKAIGVKSVPVRFQSREGGTGGAIRWSYQNDKSKYNYDVLKGEWPKVLKSEPPGYYTIKFPIEDLRNK